MRGATISLRALRPSRYGETRCRRAARRAPSSRRAPATACTDTPRRAFFGAPPACTCRSTKPGITYMPVASISWSACGWRSGRSGSPGVPALRIAVMRFCLTTMSTGPRGGAAGAVDQHRAADYHRLVRPEAFALRARRRRRQRFALQRLLGERLERVLREHDHAGRARDEHDEAGERNDAGVFHADILQPPRSTGWIGIENSDLSPPWSRLRHDPRRNTEERAATRECVERVRSFSAPVDLDSPRVHGDGYSARSACVGSTRVARHAGM